jgi:hypothetical protein
MEGSYSTNNKQKLNPFLPGIPRSHMEKTCEEEKTEAKKSRVIVLSIDVFNK